MKNVLLLPGTLWQLELAKSVKKHGYRLFVVSPEENPPCRNIADDYFRSDIFAIDDIEAYCRKMSIHAIISDECDIAVPVVAKLSEKLGILSLGSAMAQLYTDKHEMRRFCFEHNLKSPKYKLCSTIAEAKGFYTSIGKKMIIKPVDSNSSHGVFTIRSSDDIEKYFYETLRFSKVTKSVLLEEYIDGTEFTVDGIKTPYGNYPLAISEKKHFGYNENIAYELFFTHKSRNFDYEKLKAEYNNFVLLSGLKFGFTHAEYKFKDGDFYLIEIGARGGGNMISSVISEFMSGYDTYGCFIDCALGNFYKQDFDIDCNHLNKACVLKFFDAPTKGGTVSKIKGEEILQSNSAVLRYGLNFKIGDVISKAENDSARIGYYIAGAESEAELRSIMNTVEGAFSIDLENTREVK